MANDDRDSGETSRYGIGCIVGKLHSYHVTQFDPAALIRHLKLREDLQLPKDFVIHSLRHTFLTGSVKLALAFTIKKVAGHSSVTISERYVHPTPEGQERAF